MLNKLVDGPVVLHKRDIARLTIEQMERLNFDAMVSVVLASEMPVRNVERIHAFEGDTIVRLVRMAREYCRKEADAIEASVGHTVPF